MSHRISPSKTGWPSLNLVIFPSLNCLRYGLFVWIVVKLYYKNHSSETHNEAYTNIIKRFLNFWAVILEESTSDEPPHVPSIFLMWVLYCWAVNTLYQTFLTSSLVDTGLQSQISSEKNFTPGWNTASIRLSYSIFNTLRPNVIRAELTV